MASVSLALQVGSPAASIVAVTPVAPWAGSQQAGFTYPQADVPAAAGSVVATVAVTVPSNWSGAFSLSGPNASSFALSGNNLVVGATALTNGAYDVTIMATP